MLTAAEKTNFKKAQKTYNRLKAENERVLKIDNQNKLKVLTENIFYSEKLEAGGSTIQPERIINPNADYQMSESDFITYIKLVYDLNIKSGLSIPDYNTTADHQIRKDLKAAEESLIDAGFSIIPKNIINHEVNQKMRTSYKHRQELISLMVRLSL